MPDFFVLFCLFYQDPRCIVPREINKTVKKLPYAWIRPVIQILTKSERGLFGARDPSFILVSWKYARQILRKPADKPTHKWTRVKTKMFVSTQLARTLC